MRRPRTTLRGRTARGMLALLALASCDECTLFAASAEVEHEANGRTVTIEAQGFRSIGIGGFGAAHAFGVIYPTLEEGGARITMVVDDRPAVTIALDGSHGTPDSEQVAAMASAADVEVSEDGEHVAARYDGGEWHVYHLLPVGTPFDAPGSTIEGESVDLSAFDDPLVILTATLADHDVSHDYQLLWAAVLAQPAGEPWDSAIFGAWPAVEEARLWLPERFESDPPLSEQWRAAAFDRARAEIESDRFSSLAIELLIALDGEALAWLDVYVTESWPADPRPDDFAATHYLEGRLGYPTTQAVGATPMAPETMARGAAASREILEAAFATGSRSESEEAPSATDFRLAAHWLRRAGDPSAIAWLDAKLLSRWPATEPAGTRWAMLRAAVADTTTESWKARARRRAFEELDTNRALSVELLLELDDYEGSHDRALDSLLSEWSYDNHRFLRLRWPAGSAAWRTRTLREIDRRLSLGPEIPRNGDDDASVARLRAAELGTALVGNDGDCERLREYSAIIHYGAANPEVPPRCRTSR